MLSSIQQQAVVFAKQVLNDAVKFYKLEGFDVESIAIMFDLKGKVAGQAVNYAYSFRPIKIRLHSALLSSLGLEQYKNTIIHECAHLVADYIYKTTCNHNKYWVSVCKFMGGTAERCHNYDLSAICTTAAYHSYKCDCKNHQVSTRLHNNIKKGNKIYYCKTCLATLVYVNNN